MGWLKVAVLSLLIGGCVAPQPISPSVPFNQAEYGPYLKKGTGKIQGQTFLTTNGGEVRYGAGVTVTLTPATRYSKSVYSLYQQVRGQYATVRPDERWRSQKMTTETDAQGYFIFEKLAEGDYFIESRVTWKVAGSYGLEATGGSMRRQVTVHNDEITRGNLTGTHEVADGCC